MKKIIIFLIFICVLSLLSANILRVGNGQAYSSIQTAINESANNDTVLVYPGTYYECLDVLNKSLTIGSLYLITGDSLYASQTIIDADYQGTVFYASECPFLKISGFSIVHGSGDMNDGRITEGGGVYLRFCPQFIFENNIVKNNFATDGGGMYLVQSSGILSANVVCYNAGFFAYSAGGIIIGRHSYYPEIPVVEFDPVRLNDVYLNTGQVCNDILFTNLGDITNVSIRLNKFTVLNPSSYYIRRLEPLYSLSGNTNYTTQINESVISEIEADLYVSTNGDDTNVGTDINSPLKTIFMAMSKIKGDSLHQRTIFVDAGVYGYEEEQSLLPINLKSYVNIKGINGSFTIDADNIYPVLRSFSNKNHKIENMNIINANEHYSPNIIYLRSDNVEMNNIDINSVDNTYARGDMQFSDYHGLILNNIRIKGNLRGTGIGTMQKNPIKMSNISMSNLNGGLFILSAYQYNEVLTPIYLSNILLENMRNYGISGLDGSILITQLILMGWSLQDRQTFYLSNISLYNSGTAGSVGSIFVEGPVDIEMYNSMIFNKYANFIKHSLSEGNQTAIYKNCFFPEGENTIVNYGDPTGLTYTMENIISGDPMLVGYGDYPALPMAQSPLIDAGTLDLPEGFILPDTDVAGNPRIWGNGIDIGALERQNCGIDNETIDLKPINVSFYPNPMITANSNSGTFSVKLNEKGNSELIVYNIKGQKVATLMSGFREAGESTIYWNGKDDEGKRVSSGVYFFKYSCNGYEKTEKITIVK